MQKGRHMASCADLDVASLYRSSAPAWLLTAVRPERPTVVNIKGLKQDDVLVVMRLADSNSWFVAGTRGVRPARRMGLRSPIDIYWACSACPFYAKEVPYGQDLARN